PRMHGVDLLRAVHKTHPTLPSLVLTAHGRIDTAVEAMKLGAVDFLEKPLPSPEALRVLVRGIVGQARTPAPPSTDRLWHDPVMDPITTALRKVARTDATVLLQGESGTGKEVSARAVHRWSRRADGPFVAINAATLSETLLESELFGHEKGAFTGANERHLGQLERASGGTFFLDEVGELGPTIQARLLRVLQERRYQRVGGHELLTANVRWIAATNRDLRQMVQKGSFRDDLYHRLAVFPVTLPPLRDRPGDVWPLAQTLLTDVAQEVGRPELSLDPSCEAPLRAHSWPGNVRELRNALERACILVDQEVLRPADIEGVLHTGAPAPATARAPSLEEAEKQAIVAALALHDGHRKRAATHLGIGLRTLYDKLKRYDLT
ncbi:MAG: sigma-54-dependent transcriptional regulator, partial [Myxococcota bacterium]